MLPTGNLFKNLESLKNVVQEGVREFSTAALHEVREGVAQSSRAVLEGSKHVAITNTQEATAERVHIDGISVSLSRKAGSSEDNENDFLEQVLPSSSHQASSPAHSRRASHEQPMPTDKIAQPLRLSIDATAPRKSSETPTSSAAPASSSLNASSLQAAAPREHSHSTPHDNTDHPSITSTATSDPSATSSASTDPAAPHLNQPADSHPDPITIQDQPPSITSQQTSSQSQPSSQHYALNTRSITTPTSRPLPDTSSSSSSDPPSSLHPLKLKPPSLPSSSTSTPRATSSPTTAPSKDDDMRRAYDEMCKAYDDMKHILKSSMAECMRLSDEVVRLEQQLRAAQAAAAKSAAAADAAQQQAGELAAALAAAREEVAVVSRELRAAEEKVEVQEQQQKQQARSSPELDMLRTELAMAVGKVAAAVQAMEAAEAQAAAAEARRAEAEAARMAAENLRRKAQAEAQAALAAAEAERNNRAEAQGMSEVLRQESERRARVFNNAVKAAVSKVQKDLQAECDELQRQLLETQRLLEGSRRELAQAYEQVEVARGEAQARAADAEAAGSLAVLAEQATERAQFNEQDALGKARAAEAAAAEASARADVLERERAAAQQLASKVQQQLEQLQSELGELQAVSDSRIHDLQRDVASQQQQAEAAAAALAAAEARLKHADVSGRETMEKALSDVALHKARIDELEAELQQLRTSSRVMSLFQLPTKEDVLAGLGLEVSLDDRLRWKSEGMGDVEGGVAVSPESKGAQGPVSGGGQAVKRIKALAKDVAKQGVSGTVSLRVGLLIAYLVVLHIAVMISYTKSSESRLLTCDKIGTGVLP